MPAFDECENLFKWIVEKGPSQRAMTMILRGLAMGLVAAVPSIGIFMRCTLGRLYRSIQVLPPTQKQLLEEPADANPLFRAFPAMRTKVAWRQLGRFPSPVHRFQCRLPETPSAVNFWVKREDLSSHLYGGNKVRTLQYQLAACEAKAEQLVKNRSKSWKVIAFGSYGSNQVVAAKTHAAMLTLPPDSLEAAGPLEDEKEMDNTLNFLSATSLPGHQIPFGQGMGRLLSRIYSDDWAFMPGGNGPLGVLGQVGALLELANQIEAGEMPDPDGIVVAMGSNCTATGLILGVALSRKLGRKAFRQPGFCIHGQVVHHGIAAMQRLFGVLKTQSIPLMVGHGVRSVSSLLVSLGGPDITVPALKVLSEEVVIHADAAIVGRYGAHSKESHAAKDLYDKFIQPVEPDDARPLWLCGHFTAKSFAVMLRLLRSSCSAGGQQKNFLFWQTKSAVQPLGPLDEWASFQEQKKKNKALAKWAVVGGQHGTGHPSAIGKETQNMCPLTSRFEYQHLMTRLSLPG